MMTSVFDKPSVDKRSYRSLVLQNRLRAIVVHDPECITGGRKAAASLCLNVGKLHEPKSLPGLAHFCEHMLFLGTKRFPEEGSYKSFAKKHAGSVNAVTDYTYTAYHFDIDPAFLAPMLDQFSEFFVSPLLTKSAVDREIHAVDSEHQMKLNVDSRKLGSILTLDIAEKHPYHWGSGSFKSLKTDPEKAGLDLHSELLRFYELFYSSNQMGLCVIGKESLDKLEEIVHEKFSAIVDKDIDVLYGYKLNSSPDIATEPFANGSYAKKVLFCPHAEKKLISFDFLLPWQGEPDKWKTKSARFLCHFIGHEGVGSLLSLLKQKNLATSLSAGTSTESGCFSELGINVAVPSPECFEPAIVKEIGEIVFAYIDLLRHASEQTLEKLFDDERKLSEVKFQFSNQLDSYDLATTLAHAAVSRKHDSNDLNLAMSAESKYFEFSFNEIKEILDLMDISSPIGKNNFRLTLTGKIFEREVDQIDPYYFGKFKKFPIDEEFISSWSTARAARFEELRLPLQNKYIPEDLSLRDNNYLPAYINKYVDMPMDSAKMKLAENEPIVLKVPFNLKEEDPEDNPEGVLLPLWRPDYIFGQPKAKLAFKIYSPVVVKHVEGNVASALWCDMVEEMLNEVTYDAGIAGLNYSLNRTTTGLVFVVSGFNDRIAALVETVLEMIADLATKPFDEKLFKNIHQLTIDRLKNAAFKAQPRSTVSNQMWELVNGHQFAIIDRLKCLEELSIIDVNCFNQDLFENSYIESLAEGNIAPDEYIEIAKNVQKIFHHSGINEKGNIDDMDRIPSVEREAVLLPGKTKLEVFECLNEHDINNALQICNQIPDTIFNRAVLNVFTQAISAPFFKMIRTEQQLGYVAGAGMSSSVGFIYLIFVLQTQYPTDYALLKMQEAVARFRAETLNVLSIEEFNSYKQAVVTKLKNMPSDVSTQFGRDWHQITERTFDFHDRLRLIAQVEGLPLEEFLLKSNSFLDEMPSIVVEVISPNPDVAKLTTIREKIGTTEINHSFDHIIKNRAQREDYLSKVSWVSQNDRKGLTPKGQLIGKL